MMGARRSQAAFGDYIDPIQPDPWTPESWGTDRLVHLNADDTVADSGLTVFWNSQCGGSQAYATQPSYRAAEAASRASLNNQLAVEMNSDDNYRMPALPGTSTSFGWFMVVDQLVDVGYQTAIRNSVSSYTCYLAVLGEYGYKDSSDHSFGVSTQTGPQAVAWIVNDTSCSLYVNGVNLGATLTVLARPVVNATGTAVDIIFSSSSSAIALDSFVADVCCLGRAVGSLDIDLHYAWAKEKYDIP
jgi:hypothetical protein